MKRIALFLFSVLIVLASVLAVSCGGDSDVTIIFNQEMGACTETGHTSTAIQCNGDVISFEGSVITPNPCYYLKAGLGVFNQSHIEIALTALSSSGVGGYCIECLGEISFSGTVDLSGACSMIASIVYDSTVIAEYEGR